MDLKFDGLGKSNSVGIDTNGKIDQVLILNMDIPNIGNGILFNASILEWWYRVDGLTAHTMFDEIAIVDSTISPIFNSATGWRIYASATRASIQGNTLGNMLNNSSMGSHVVRVPYMEKGVIANNIIARPGVTQVGIKLHGRAWCENTSPPETCTYYDNVTPPTTYNYLNNTHPISIYAALNGNTEKIIISDNEIIGAGNPYTISISSQNFNSDERLRDIIVERNWFTSGAATRIILFVTSSNTTIRNNILDIEGTTNSQTPIWITPPGTSPPAANVFVYNNTFYGGSTTNESFVGVRIDATASNVSVVNNLASATGANGPVMIEGTGASGLTSANNLLNNTPSALFISATPSSPADFSLKALPNPARDTGLSSVPVHSDFFLSVRPQGTTDIGAVEGP